MQRWSVWWPNFHSSSPNPVFSSIENVEHSHGYPRTTAWPTYQPSRYSCRYFLMPPNLRHPFCILAIQDPRLWVVTRPGPVRSFTPSKFGMAEALTRASWMTRRYSPSHDLSFHFIPLFFSVPLTQSWYPIPCSSGAWMPPCLDIWDPAVYDIRKPHNCGLSWDLGIK